MSLRLRLPSLFASRLAKKQLALILLFSTIITLIGTSIQLLIEYRTERSGIELQFDRIANSHLSSLTTGLWYLDNSQITVQLESILNLQDVVYAEIAEKGVITYSAGNPAKKDLLLHRDYKMNIHHDKVVEEIGTLGVFITLGNVHKRMIRRTLVILVTQGVKTFLVSLFILFILHNGVTRHLLTISDYTQTFCLEKLLEPLAIDKHAKKDELDQLVASINSMRQTIIDDLERQKTAEKEREELHEQLSHARKLESIGRLAGGTAHEFNNMLSIIIGYSELSLDSSEPGSTLAKNLKEVIKAAEHAASITRNLLAFSRKQPITPGEISLNETVQGMLPMVTRLMPDNIRVSWEPGSLPCKIYMDPSQIDQLVINLCLNARDAMQDNGGKISVATESVHLTDTGCSADGGIKPGHYCTLRVKDCGCGIKEEILSKIFDPFFTTKDVGKGPGLGLATVYGIIKQNDGFIDVITEVGKGTSFTVYLPRL